MLLQKHSLRFILASVTLVALMNAFIVAASVPTNNNNNNNNPSSSSPNNNINNQRVRKPAPALHRGETDENSQMATSAARVRSKLVDTADLVESTLYSKLGHHADSSTHGTNKPATARIGGDGALSASYAIPTARNLGIASGPSPFYAEAYGNRDSVFDILQDIPYAPLRSWLNMPLLVAISLFNGAIDFFAGGGWTMLRVNDLPTAAITPNSRGTASMTTTSPFFRLAELSLNQYARAAAAMRRVTSITVKSDAVQLEIVHTRLPPGVERCSDFAGAESVETDLSLPQCVPLGDLSFRSPTGCVNTVVRWVRNTFWRVARASALFGDQGRSDDDQSTEPVFGDHTPTCTIDWPLHSKEDDRRTCVFARCVNLAQCSKAVDIEVRQWLESDVAVVYGAILLGVLAWMVRPWAARSHIVRVIICLFLGVGMLMMLVIFGAWNLAKDNRIGQVALVATLGVGSIFGVVHGLGLYCLQYLMELAARNPSVLYAIIAASIIATGFAHFVFGSSIPAMVHVSVLAVQVGGFAAAFLRNPELCILPAFWLLLLYVAAVVVRRFTGLMLWPFSSFFGTLADDINDAQETFPASAYREKSTVRPTASNGIGKPGMSAERKFEIYAEQGSVYTRQALKNLANVVKANPQKYAARLQDPNGVFRALNVNTNMQDD